MKTLTANISDKIKIGSDYPIVVQTMCNTHTFDVDKTVAQCELLSRAGADMIRITVPSMKDIDNIKEIKARLSEKNIDTPIVADIHFSSEIAIAVAPFVDKVRINPGNFNRDHDKACEQFSRLVQVCKEYNRAIRIGLNHGSLGERITNLYGNTPNAMALAAMEWVELCAKNDFYNVVISLKSSNTIVMVEAYRLLAEAMQKRGIVFPLHVGVTEAGNGDSGRMKSCVGVSSLLSEGIGNTIRVSLTEDPENEIPVARYLADRYDGRLKSSLSELRTDNKTVFAKYDAPSKERLLLDFACDFGKKLLDKEIDDIVLSGSYTDESGTKVELENTDYAKYLVDELMQASRRKFYKPEFIACPGCGRTMFNLQAAFEAVKEKTSKFTDTVIAVMGCVVNGPGEMADADWGYVGEGNKKVSIYKGKNPVVKHVPEEEAVDLLVRLIEEDRKSAK